MPTETQPSLFWVTMLHSRSPISMWSLPAALGASRTNPTLATLHQQPESLPCCQTALPAHRRRPDSGLRPTGVRLQAVRSRWETADRAGWSPGRARPSTNPVADPVHRRQVQIDPAAEQRDRRQAWSRSSLWSYGFGLACFASDSKCFAERSDPRPSDLSTESEQFRSSRSRGSCSLQHPSRHASPLLRNRRNWEIGGS